MKLLLQIKLPVLLFILGIMAIFTDMTYRVNGSSHYALGITSGFIALFIAILAYHITNASRSIRMNYIATAFFAVGLIDIFHAILSIDYLNIVLDDRTLIIASSSTAGHMVLSIMTLLGVINYTIYPKLKVPTLVLMLTTLILTIVSMYLISTIQISPFIFDDYEINNPWELIPLLFFLISFIILHKTNLRVPANTYTYGFLILNISVQITMAFSKGHFEFLSFLSDTLKAISYVYIGIPLFMFFQRRGRKSLSFTIASIHGYTSLFTLFMMIILFNFYGYIIYNDKKDYTDLEDQKTVICLSDSLFSIYKKFPSTIINDNSDKKISLEYQKDTCNVHKYEDLSIEYGIDIKSQISTYYTLLDKLVLANTNNEKYLYESLYIQLNNYMKNVVEPELVDIMFNESQEIVDTAVKNKEMSAFMVLVLIFALTLIPFMYSMSNRYIKRKIKPFARQLDKMIALSKYNETIGKYRKEVQQTSLELQALIDTANAPIFGIDRDGKVTEWNQTAQKLTYYAKEEVFGRDLVQDFITEDYKASVAEVLKHALDGEETSNYEFPLYTKNGAQRMILLNATPRKNVDGNIIGVIGIGQDITEIDKYRKKVEQTSLELQALIDTANAPIFGIDRDGKVTEWNQTAQKLTYYAKEEVFGRDLVQDFITEDYKASVAEVLKHALDGEGTSNYEFPLYTKDGAQKMILLNATPRKNVDGNIMGVIGIGQDITEIDRTRKELAKERLSLEKKVIERTKDLEDSLVKIQDTNLQLENINKHKSEFISSMSHELRTPLNGIIGSADLLHEQIFGTLNEKQIKYTIQIEKSANLLLSLINDILDMAKIDSGAMELEISYVNIDEWMESTVGIMQTQFRTKNIRVNMNIESQTEFIMADSRKCKQIMLNILSNALKYSPVGEEISIHISDTADEKIKVEIEDNGPGIKEEDFERIFSEFYQVDRLRDEKLSGTGIGLALTKRLVEMHGGEIGVVSDPDKKGSKFWFTLPRKEEENQFNKIKKLDSSSEVNVPSAQYKILVAEDNRVNASLLMDMLSTFNCEIKIVEDGQMAVAMVPIFKPDIILMDMKMPVMDGIEATKRIRELPQFDKVPIIAITASVTEESKKLQFKVGCTDHISKPIRRVDLMHVLTKYIK